MTDFKPDWELPPEPIGPDELDVIALYVRETSDNRRIPWHNLEEWMREAWRREYRDD